jgi:RimJ/RimL family protein N-acetyltransferase
MKIPEIETKRTLLRAFSPDDLDDLATIFSKPSVMRYMPGGRPRSREQTEETIRATLRHWEEHGFGWWAVISKEGQQLIGWCGLARLDSGSEVEVLYLLDEPYWGNGLASETARAALRYGFEELGLKQIAAVAVPENIRSRRVMERVGMVYEKVGRYHGSDLAYYVVRREEFEAGSDPYIVRRA